MRRKYTEKQRSELVKLVTAGGATVSEAAARLGVTPSTAYYWTKSATAAAPWRARRSHGSSGWPPAAPAFARVVSSGEAGAAIVVRVGAAEIQVRRDFDAELLRGVVEALREVAA
jgi:transposase-like protein